MSDMQIIFDALVADREFGRLVCEIAGFDLDSNGRNYPELRVGDDMLQVFILRGHSSEHPGVSCYDCPDVHRPPHEAIDCPTCRDQWEKFQWPTS